MQEKEINVKHVVLLYTIGCQLRYIVLIVVEPEQRYTRKKYPKEKELKEKSECLNVFGATIFGRIGLKILKSAQDVVVFFGKRKKIKNKKRRIP
jgi:hypothetical protein